MNDPKNTICRDLWAYPVIDLTRPRVRTCCKRHGEIIDNTTLKKLGTDVFLNLPEVVKERKQMMQGIQVEGCKACWDLENQGLKSFRSDEMDWQYHFNNDKGPPVHYSKFRPYEELIKDTSDSMLKSNMPNKLDIILGTYCDQKCIYCCSDFSTQWESEDKKYGRIWGDPTDPHLNFKNIISINNQTIDGWNEEFLKWFDSVYEHLERIALLGGEPTYSPLFNPVSDHIIQKLQTNAHPNCNLVIVTNLNWKQDVLDQIIKIRTVMPESVKLTIEVSMESLESRAEYIRSGVDWNRFKSNLEKISQIDNIEIVLITTINALCITSLKNFLIEIQEIEKRYDRNFQIVANRLIFPKWLSLNILDETFIPYLKTAIRWIEENYKDELRMPKQEMLNLLYEISKNLNNDIHLLGYFCKWITEMDRRRSTDFVKIFPEYKTLFEKGKIYSKPVYTVEDMKQWSY
jgi:hypothetical protein